MPVEFVIPQWGRDGFFDDSDVDNDQNRLLPSPYVKRLWRKRITVAEGVTAITFTNKDTWDNEVQYSTLDQAGVLIMKNGKYRPSKPTVARVDWVEGTTSGKALEKSIMTIRNKAAPIKDLFKRTKAFGTSRTFIGPDGLTYKWKEIVAGYNPTFPESSYRALFAKDSPDYPVATTQRLVDRDQSAESYPVYISEKGLPMQDWIIMTLVIMEKLAG